MNHPIQPLENDNDGILRFKQNAIVRFLLDSGPNDMNKLAIMPFSDEDRQQFAQLIGYSLSGYGELSSYVTDDAYAAAAEMAETGSTEKDARIKSLEKTLSSLRKALRKPVSELFGKMDYSPPKSLTPEQLRAVNLRELNWLEQRAQKAQKQPQGSSHPDDLKGE